MIGLQIAKAKEAQREYLNVLAGTFGGRQGFRGWIDELRIYPMQDAELNPNTSAGRAWEEFQCNLALGTLVSDGRDRYCEQLQLESHATMLELGPQADMAADCIGSIHRNPVLTAMSCLRKDQHGLVGMAAHAGSARPDLQSNDFCISCHRSGHPIAGLGLSALAADPSGLPRECDGRRQPMDWPAILSGAAPSGVTPAQSSTCPADATGSTGAWNADLYFDIYSKWTP